MHHINIKIKKIVSTVIGEVWSVHRFLIAHNAYEGRMFEFMNNSKHRKTISIVSIGKNGIKSPYSIYATKNNAQEWKN